MPVAKHKKYIFWFKEIRTKDVQLVGGKNASLGEMFSKLSKKGINVPDGFAATSEAYRYFLKKNNLLPKLREIFTKLDYKDIKSLQDTGERARSLILKSEFPDDLKKEIIANYHKLSKKYGQDDIDVAVRSSATAEDLPTASFAGQHETYLNMRGETELLNAVRKCIASLFNDRAISYREEMGFDHFKIALSVGIMKMVRSDLACSGVIFTIDTESGFKDLVLIDSSWGLGEMVVKGRVIADEFLVFKPTLGQGFKPIISKKLGTKKRKLIYSEEATKQAPVLLAEQKKFTLSNDEILQLARWAVLIEEHYGMPMDIEFAKDGKDGRLFVVQARPETIHSAQTGQSYTRYILKEKGKVISQGEAIGSKIASGKAKIIPNVSKINNFKAGEVLVARMTDPDWEPIMKIAKAIITEEGSRVCHAAIVSRELGIPAIVGVKNATQIFKSGQGITVDCSNGQIGRIFAGEMEFDIKKINLKKIPKIKTKIMMNVSHPEAAFKESFLPNSGIGLAREEFIIASKIKAHPLALIKQGKSRYFVDELAMAIGQIASAFYPKPVIVRFSDFKTNEYSALEGGKEFEPKEANPMLGWRGASRYYDPKFKKAFLLECQAMKKAREEFGLKNIWAMVPFCRTVEEGEKVLKIMAGAGLKRGEGGLKVIVMCEIPSNVILADKFLDIFDGMSIGSNDLTQLALGIDRDNAMISHIGDERNEAVKHMISRVINICRLKKKYCGICGQAPSDFPDFAEFLVKEGIESISLNPDTVIKTILHLARKDVN